MQAKTQNTVNYDIAIIGGGPAGTTAATLLARKGWQVLLLEKDSHPRFHIGESLLPMTLPILAELGVLDKIKAIGTNKYGAEFNSEKEDNSLETFYFSEALDKDHPQAFQVIRSEFDEILFRNTQMNKVTALESCKVTSVSFPAAGRVNLSYLDKQKEQHHVSAKFLIDASGRETFLGRRLKLKQKSKKHHCAAIFGHFRNVELRDGKDAGNISIYWFEHGWFWMIPLRGGIMSVGAVCYPEYLKQRKVPVAKFFQASIDMVPEIRQRMNAAEALGEIQATGNFSYNSSRIYGKQDENYLLLGDAYAFIDPVFSSGVQIAMAGGKLASECVDSILQNPQQRSKFLRAYKKRTNSALKTISWLIHRFNSPAMQQIFMAPGQQFKIKETLISLLAGDLYRNTPIKFRLTLFKAIYYYIFILNFPSAWLNYRRRKKNIDTKFTGGTTPQDRVSSETDT